MFRVVHGLTPMNLVKKVLDPDLNANETIIVKQVLEILISTDPVSFASSGLALFAPRESAALCVLNGFCPAASQISLTVLVSGVSKSVSRTHSPTW